MGLQQLYDDICSHLDKQGCKSLRMDYPEEGNCLYRGEGGRRCAVGVVIPDEIYTADMEGCAVVSLLARWPALSAYFLEHYDLEASMQEAEDLMVYAQYAHDSNCLKHWAVEFERIAHDFGLRSYTFTHPNIVGEKHD